MSLGNGETAAISEAWLWERIHRICHPLSGISYGTLGKSHEGRSIPFLQFGTGMRGCLYVGGHHGMEWVTTVALLFFLEELAQGGRVKGIPLEYLRETRRLTVVPLLNVDGAYLQSGALSEEEDPYRAVKILMNGGADFSHWQANARGVDLNHNYNAGFAAYKAIEKELGITGGCSGRYAGERPESEPETYALASWIRRERPTLLLTLHTQGEEIYTPAVLAKSERGKRLLRDIASLTGYRYATPLGPAAYGGLTDWAVTALGIPAFTLECGRGENPLPPQVGFGIYHRLRGLLFRAMTW